jgi:hypothetical protein
MHHKPCGFLGNSEIAGNLIAADSILAVRNHPKSDEPLIQTNGAILKDGSDFDGKFALSMMGTAFPSPPFGAETHAFGTAIRTEYTTRPACGRHLSQAVLGVGVEDHRFL